MASVPPPPPPPSPPPQSQDDCGTIFPVRNLPYNYSFTPGTYNPPDAFYCEVKLNPDEPSLMRTVIGREGFYFKAITSATKVYYIWYSRERSVVEIWGPESRLELAMERVRQRIDRVKMIRQEKEEARAEAEAAAAEAAAE